MDTYKLVEKLKNETNISYEEAKSALEKVNWDILDAIVYLEERGKIQRPSVSTFYTNEHKENYKYREITGDKYEESNYNNSKRDNTFHGVFELVCKIIDTCNNIFFEIKKENTTFLKIPITVIILLLIFAFWIVIPLYIVGLFFDIEFLLSGSWEKINKINDIFKIISVSIRKLKEKLKKGFKNG